MLVYVVPIALAVYALFDLWRSEPVERAGLRRWVWVLIVVLLPVVGPIAWILVSRTYRARGGRAARRGPRPGRPPQRRGPVAPDDDPDFLRRLEQEQRRRRREQQDADEDSGEPTSG